MIVSPSLPKTGKRELQKEARRVAIIEAALEAFTSQGFTATKLDEVAERAGIGKGTIYLYFNSKENLFEEVVRHNMFPVRDAAASFLAGFTGSASDLLRSHLRNVYSAMSNPKIPLLMAMIFSEGLRFPSISSFVFKEVISHSQDMIRNIILRGVASGEFRADAAKTPSQLLISPALVASTWNLQYQEHAPLDMNAYIEAHIDFVLRALKP
jgi:AcrR family transcriptional regulator